MLSRTQIAIYKWIGDCVASLGHGEEINKQIGCHHAWENYHSEFDPPFNKHPRVQCHICKLVVRAEKADNLTEFNCPNCGKFVVWAEEIAGLHYNNDITCKQCKNVAIYTSQCVL